MAPGELELAAAVVPLLNARAAIEQQIADLDRKVMRLARNNAQARRFMTAPGVGPITALCFLATIDDPTPAIASGDRLDRPVLGEDARSEAQEYSFGKQPSWGISCEANRAA